MRQMQTGIPGSLKSLLHYVIMALPSDSPCLVRRFSNYFGVFRWFFQNLESTLRQMEEDQRPEDIDSPIEEDDDSEESVLSGSSDSEPFELPFNIPVDVPLVIGDTPQVIYFTREFKRLVKDNTHQAQANSPPQTRSDDTSALKSAISSKGDRLAMAIMSIEARVSKFGALRAPQDIVRKAKKTTNEQFYNADDEFLDDEEVDYASGSESSEIDPLEFRAVKPEDDLSDTDEPIPQEPAPTAADEYDRLGDRPDWREVLLCVEDKKRPMIQELLQELEDSLNIAGSTRQRKLKIANDAASIVRRLVPKTSRIQNIWRKVFTNLLEDSAINDIKPEAFEMIWDEASVARQKEVIFENREELVKSVDPLQIKDACLSWKKAEALTWKKYEKMFAALNGLWKLWRKEEECAGRVIFPDLKERQRPTTTERRFASHLVTLFPAITDSASLILVRVALFGQKRGLKPIQPSPANSDDDQAIQGVQILPLRIWLYRKNCLLACKLNEVTSLTKQAVSVTEKEWEGSARDYTSLLQVYESYQQRYVKKQDRLPLTSAHDVWKHFAIKLASGEFQTLYDFVQKAAIAHDWCFVDKFGFPIFFPSIGAARVVDVKNKENRQKVKEDKKKPPFGSEFLAFKQFNAADFTETVAETAVMETAAKETAAKETAGVVDEEVMQLD